MTTRILRWLPVALLLVTAASEVMAQTPVPWYRRGRLEGAYDLRGTTILVVAGRDFNRQETIEMAECWRRWGAQVEFAGPERMLAAERDEAPGVPPPASPATLRMDWLLSEADPSRYDVLYVAGGEGVGQLFADHRAELARLIDQVHARGGIVSAICHGPLALAASSAIKGKRLTVQGTSARETLERAGAVVVSEAAVVDGSLVTGQWPHLEEFAVTLAERVKYPGGGGPREKALAARSPVERALDDMRDTQTFQRRTVPPEAVETLMRGAQRAVAARGTRGSRAMRFVAVSEPGTKAELARQNLRAEQVVVRFDGDAGRSGPGADWDAVRGSAHSPLPVHRGSGGAVPRGCGARPARGHGIRRRGGLQPGAGGPIAWARRLGDWDAALPCDRRGCETGPWGARQPGARRNLRSGIPGRRWDPRRRAAWIGPALPGALDRRGFAGRTVRTTTPGAWRLRPRPSSPGKFRRYSR